MHNNHSYVSEYIDIYVDGMYEISTMKKMFSYKIVLGLFPKFHRPVNLKCFKSMFD